MRWISYFFISLVLVVEQCLAIPPQFIPSQNAFSQSTRLKLAAPYAPVYGPIDDDGPAVGKNRITYSMGGIVLTGDVHVYIVYYGNWTQAQRELTETFISGIGSTEWYKVNQLYYFQQNGTSPKIYAQGRVVLGTTVLDEYSKGSSLSGNDIPLIVQDMIVKGAFPEDSNGIYFVLNSADVEEQSRYGTYKWCDAYCGYHGSWNLPSGKRIRYSQAGLPPLDTCFNACSPRHHRYRSPNNDTPLDSMVSILAHELVEVVTDPDFDDRIEGDPQSQGDRFPGWMDGYSQECADKCAFQFGNVTHVESERYWYNLEFSGKQWLIQENWHPELQACASRP